MVNNDFKREMYFYRQGQAAVMEGYSRLTELNLPTNRPEDYFAEMAKNDEHMFKVNWFVLFSAFTLIFFHWY